MYSPFQQRRQLFTALKEKRQKPQPTQPVKTVDQPMPFVACAACNAAIPRQQLSDCFQVCPHCGHHHPMTAPARLAMLFDEGTAKTLAVKQCYKNDPLKFAGYAEKIALLRKKINITDAVLSAVGKIGGQKAVVCVMDSRFLMGSMGSAVGEAITQAVEYAGKNRLPIIIFCASGGARMQEGAVSLMQMAKTSAALKRFSDEGGLYIPVLTHPTTGGVSASFAMLGDITLAEPNALIGFAGPRVIQQTIGETLPEGFQRAEYLQEHGFVDDVVPRSRLKTVLAQLIRLHTAKGGMEKC